MSVVLQQLPRSRRVARRPVHNFKVHHKPFALQPFLLAPVLPGETLKNLTLQSRCVTDPVKDSLSGWWLEYYIFYVKHRDLVERDEFTQMAIDPSWTPVNVDDPTPDANHYFHGTAAGSQINWSKLCMKVVVDHYMRNEGEAWDAYALGGLPLASMQTNSWLDSVMPATDYEAVDVNVDLDADTNITASEVESAMQQWQMLRMNNMTEQTYEQFLQTYGVRVQNEEIHKPELIRYIREWSYPSNTVDPSNGSPSAALSWSVTERADKDRYFKEPGFIYGLTLARPKTFMQYQTGAAAQAMNNIFSWLPAVMSSDPASSLQKVTAGHGPLALATDDYMWDVRDLLVYGDQFSNLLSSGGPVVPLPTAALEKRYISSATEQYNFFVDDTNASGLTNANQNGIVNLNILGHQVDTTPSVNPGTS